MAYTVQNYGYGDPQFTGVKVISENGEPVAVYIQNAGRSGGQFYRADSIVVAAAQRLNSTHSPGAGVHVADFARAVVGDSFYVNSSVPGHSTKEAEGANRAMGLVHQALQAKGLRIPFPNAEMQDVVGVRSAFRPDRSGRPILPTGVNTQLTPAG